MPRRQRQDYSDHVRKHPSPSVRLALVLLGVALGIYLYRIPSRDRA